MSRYLIFKEETPQGRKTALVVIYSRLHGDRLGEIRWFGRWRQYACFPAVETIWNPECLADVTDQIRALMAARREAVR